MGVPRTMMPSASGNRSARSAGVISAGRVTA